MYLGAGFFAALTLVLVVMIYANLYIKKKRFFSRQQISEQLNLWISTALIEESVQISVAPWLEDYMAKRSHREYITDSLINIKKNIIGSAADNIVTIYEQLGLKKDSLKKLAARKWHEKSRGIYELYMMGQRDAMPLIAAYTNSGNEAVRTEAQTAVVGFDGFKGLGFLNTLTHPLNNWQQLKLLEQLTKLDPTEMPDLPRWLTSENHYVQLFALKLADIFQQFQVHDIVAAALDSPHESIRCQAIKTLGHIADERTPGILKARYASETPDNKKNILRQLCSIGGSDDIAFLVQQLKDEDHYIKLEAGRAIVRCNENGIKLLDSVVAADEVLLSISRQIKYELVK